MHTLPFNFKLDTNTFMLHAVFQISTLTLVLERDKKETHLCRIAIVRVDCLKRVGGGEWRHFSHWLWHTSVTLTLNEGSHSLVCPPQYSWGREESWGSRGRGEEARETRTRARLNGDRPNWGQTIDRQLINGV